MGRRSCSHRDGNTASVTIHSGAGKPIATRAANQLEAFSASLGHRTNIHFPLMVRPQLAGSTDGLYSVAQQKAGSLTLPHLPGPLRPQSHAAGTRRLWPCSNEKLQDVSRQRDRGLLDSEDRAVDLHRNRPRIRMKGERRFNC
jgi:hypothetical protein